jgi:hypothetical protein
MTYLSSLMIPGTANNLTGYEKATNHRLLSPAPHSVAKTESPGSSFGGSAHINWDASDDEQMTRSAHDNSSAQEEGKDDVIRQLLSSMVWLSDNVVYAAIDRVLAEVGYNTVDDTEDGYYYEDESEEEGSDETSAVSEITEVFDYLESNGKRFAATNLSKSLGSGSFQVAVDVKGLDVMETDFGRVRSLGTGVMPSISVTSLGGGEFPIICSISLYERESTTGAQEIDILPQQEDDMSPRILHDDFEEDDDFKKARTTFVRVLADYIILTLRGTRNTRDGRLSGDTSKCSPQHHMECELALKALGVTPWALHIAPKSDPFPYDLETQEELLRLQISLDRLQQREIEREESQENERDPLIGMTIEIYMFD